MSIWNANIIYGWVCAGSKPDQWQSFAAIGVSHMGAMHYDLELFETCHNSQCPLLGAGEARHYIKASQKALTMVPTVVPEDDNIEAFSFPPNIANDPSRGSIILGENIEKVYGAPSLLVMKLQPPSEDSAAQQTGPYVQGMGSAQA
ncbi:hypothetical protein Cadr_000031356 [Camelus dromedarius]|uniref:Uncharacterized protein n=1 Tax=Camelus dromedarius TaxID=9838 RepID=A0A5N4BX32_CAMDR|nr:hypothetical protein Cadr_000031356 [Camelus dromedarius]